MARTRDTAKLDAFCRLIAGGSRPAAAYMEAYSVSYSVARASCARLMRDASIAERIQELILEGVREVKEELAVRIAEDPGAFSKIGRAKRLAELRRKVFAVIEARARDPVVAEVPGGKTGLIVLKPMQKKIVAMIDRAPIEMVLALDKQIAIELGQWVERQEVGIKPPEQWTPEDWKEQADSFIAKVGIPAEEIHRQLAEKLQAGELVLDVTPVPEPLVNGHA